MKKLLTSSLLVLVAVNLTLAQRVVNAKEIFDKIDRREAVAYENVIIEGDLDLTNLSNQHRVNEGRWDGSTETYLSTVETPLTFRKCTFKGKFLAYRAEPKAAGLFNSTSKLFNANFTETLTFENCTFQEDAAFKYAELRQRTTFTGSTFRRLAEFKYARFGKDSDFGGCQFTGVADFKYTHFNEATAFRNGRFDGIADFKYTNFGEGVDFRSARFAGMADFKYTHLPNGSSFAEATFDGLSDFKYATLDGRRFSPGR